MTLLFVDGDFGIKAKPLQLNKKATTKWFTGTVHGESAGKEGFIVVAVPMELFPNAPDMGFLD